MGALPPLYLIADQATCGDQPMLDVLERALDAGVRLVQLREKALDRAALMRVAEDVLVLTARYEAALVINTAADLAVQIGAQGVHLPSHGSPKAIREQFDSPLLIGYSAHSHAELDNAGGADFVTYSPVFTPGSKPGYDGSEVGVDGLQDAVNYTPLSVYALGGITPARVVACRKTGCVGVAVMSGILAADDPARAVCEFLKAWES
ncbi:MAG: thiamine phosphate synthase [Candidatus Latescibacteria bacterium]|jgi:thiamine-phosphate pyrophosphorylase|nr:thiamine phosphate synthase [Candidatus Latescibacterota bacterium]